jgi:hypothetical protein
MSLSLSPNSLYRQTTDCTEGGGLTRSTVPMQLVPITTNIVSPRGVLDATLCDKVDQ